MPLRHLVCLTAVFNLFLCLPVTPLWAGPLMGPKTYTRTTGQPNTYTEAFTNCEPQSLYKLVALNGNPDGSQRLSSATVLLNGQEILRPNELNQGVDKVEKPVPVQPAENRLEVRLASGPGGQLTISIECMENCFEVKIASLPPGVVLNQDRVIVTGTVQSSSEEVGIVVNTVSGQVAGPPFTFAVPDVHLESGSHTLTATAIDSCGMQATTTVEVNVQNPQEPLVILSTSPSGVVASAPVHFRALAIPPNPVVSYQWNFTTQTGPDLTVTYDTPGLYFPQVTVTDKKGLTYTATAVINVLDPTRLSTQLQAKWTKMREAMKTGNIEQAVGYFTYGSRERYRKIFDAIRDKLGEEAANLQDIALVSFSGTTAKYRIQRTVAINGQPQTLTYWVYFIQDTDGIWRIRQF